ncbi:hypothetical protein BV372_00500 [Nostoc sp. T09]|uniref:GIY-YIG nuclease family protein n=1 Tax=Nostoc sp. T09 TaxID=1932621 RepID=UPI000A3C40C6|nr:GIY-YIG nuclease family protein [Nostoc sp. T09]OUL37481.1 hypothetical protein BV372_00500 [Nostoc sp. T09]
MTSGVYIITNKTNGRKYIGYSEDIEYRFEANKRELQKGSFGRSRHQQFIDDYQQCGEEAFISGILEVTPNESSLMKQRAENWKNIIKPEYNQ